MKGILAFLLGCISFYNLGITGGNIFLLLHAMLTLALWMYGGYSILDVLPSPTNKR